MSEELKREEVRAWLVGEIAHTTGFDESEINDEDSLVEELDYNSLDLTELQIYAEEEFGVIISDEAASEVKTVKDVIDLILHSPKDD